MDALIYDCEIIRCILPMWEDPDPTLAYCNGWHDFVNMGISCIAVWDCLRQIPRVFLKDNFDEFQALVWDRQHIIGFNSLAFDDKLCEASELKVHTTYDVLCEVRVASGQPANYVWGQTRKGYSLQALALANLDFAKSGSGEMAPLLWQRENYGQVIDYCLRDVMLVKQLLDLEFLKDPTNGEQLSLSRPWIG